MASQLSRNLKPHGQHPHNRLSAAFVRSAPPGRHFDGQGLFLLVEQSGARRWGQRLVIRGKRRELGLGSPPLVPLAEARELALQNRKLARSGGDPIAHRREAEKAALRHRSIPTFAKAVDGSMEVIGAEFSSEKYRKQWRATIDAYAMPTLGSTPVDQIDADDVLAVLKPIWHDKTDTARRLRGRLEAVFRWATMEGYREGENPARWKDNLEGRLPRPGRIAKSEHHPAIQLADLPDWWAKLAKREGMAARALEFLALTAARSGEVRGMTWNEVDFDAAIWTVPAARMKMDREHRVPLPKAAVELLENLPRLGSASPVFFAPMGGMLSDMSVSAVVRRMHEAELNSGRVGFVDRQSGRRAVPHGLRSSFRDWVAECTGYPGEMAEVALAHKTSNAVEAAYRRGDQVEKRRQMMEAWAQFLGGRSGEQVVTLVGRHV